MNHKAFNKNFKFNASQHEKGDMTIIDRTETLVENKKNKDFLEVALRPALDFSMDWQCSLR